MPLVDSHCHLDLYPNFTDLVSQCENQKIYTLAVTTTPRAWPRNFELTKNNHFVKAALGFHPQLVIKDFQNELSLWEKYLPQTRYIGEIGIDSSANYIHTLDSQTEVFRQILKSCSKYGNKILSIHSLKSSKLILNYIEELFPPGSGKIILHWFTGSLAEAKKAIDIGCVFSVNPNMITTKNGQEIIRLLPIEKILTETDGPFVKYRGNPIKPSDIVHMIPTLAAIKNLDSDTLLAKIASNFETLSK